MKKSGSNKAFGFFYNGLKIINKQKKDKKNKNFT